MTELRALANNVGRQMIGGIVYPNDQVNNGIINDNYAPLDQVPFILGFANPQINHYYDTSYQYETGRGEIPVPFSTDFYIGEVL